MAIGSRLRHVIESQQFSRSMLEEIFARTEEIKREPHRFMARLNGQIMAALFYEPSPRTRPPFRAARWRPGGGAEGPGTARAFRRARRGQRRAAARRRPAPPGAPFGRCRPPRAAGPPRRLRWSCARSAASGSTGRGD